MKKTNINVICSLSLLVSTPALAMSSMDVEFQSQNESITVVVAENQALAANAAMQGPNHCTATNNQVGFL